MILLRNFKKLCNMKVTVIPIVIVTVTRGFVKGLEDIKKTMSRDNINYSIDEIGQNT